jgi:hypothetical protein
VRIGLVGAGAVIAIVGAGLLVSLFFLPGPPTDTRITSVSISDLNASATRTWTISEDTVLSGSLSVSWTSSGAATVQLWKAHPCPVGVGYCPIAPAVVSWNESIKGQWSAQGPVVSVYLLSATNYGGSAISFTSTLTESYPVSTPAAVVPAWALIAVGGLFLLGIGALAIFLGFFLASGVYRPPRSGVEEFYPDQDEDIANRAPDPAGPGEL